MSAEELEAALLLRAAIAVGAELVGERERARATAVRLEQECAELERQNEELVAALTHALGGSLGWEYSCQVEWLGRGEPRVGLAGVGPTESRDSAEEDVRAWTALDRRAWLVRRAVGPWGTV